MTFLRTPFWVVHLIFDLAITATSLGGALSALKRARAKGEGRVAFLSGAAIAGGAVGLLPWFVWGVMDGGIWGFSLIARALWTAATVAAPLLALGAAVRSRRSWLVPAILLVALKYSGEVWEPSRLEITRVTIPVAGLRSPVRVAHFADLQTDGIRAKELAMRDAVDAFDPDFVTFTGDVLNHPSLVPQVFSYLHGISARRGKLFVGGDVDGGLDRERFERETGFEWLDGRVRPAEAGGARLAFLGFGLLDYLRGRDFARGLVERAGRADVLIALSHRPDAAFALAGTGVPLLFAGHTHGGQIQIPFFGPIVKLSAVPRRVAAGGVSSLLGIVVVLSRGIGWEGHIAPRVRLFCQPQVILATLVPAPAP